MRDKIIIGLLAIAESALIFFWLYELIESISLKHRSKFIICGVGMTWAIWGTLKDLQILKKLNNDTNR